MVAKVEFLFYSTAYMIINFYIVVIYRQHFSIEKSAFEDFLYWDMKLFPPILGITSMGGISDTFCQFCSLKQ